jgi:hypothetical protein
MQLEVFTPKQIEKYTWLLTNKKLSKKHLYYYVADVIDTIERILWKNSKDWEV